MKKIAFVINYIVQGGPSYVVRNIINNLSKREYQCTLVTLFAENDERIVQEIKSKDIEVIQCTSLNRLGCLAGMTLEFDQVIRENCFDIIHSHGIIPDILSARICTEALKVSTLHNNMFEDYLDTFGAAKGRLFIALHLRYLKRIDFCVCCSKSVYIVMKKYLNNVRYVSNGIGETFSKNVITRKELSVPDDALVFIYAGQLNTGKNIIWLISKFVQYHHQNEYLIVLGKGDMGARCANKADCNVKFIGLSNDPIAYFKIADVYASASKSEGLSISVLEALDNGLVLLLSNIPSHSEIIDNCSSTYIGEVFKIDNENNFAQAIEKIRAARFDRHKIKAYKNELYSAKKMAVGYEHVYNKCVTNTDASQC